VSKVQRDKGTEVSICAELFLNNIFEAGREGGNKFFFLASFF